MDPIEILGALLRGSSGGQSQGGNILRDILGGGEAEEASPAPQAERPVSQASPPASNSGRPTNVIDTWRRESAGASPPAAPRPAPSSGRWNGGDSGLLRPPAPAPAANREEEAVYLIRAMINAARADGEMDREEEQKILQHLGQPTQQVVAFIREEFGKPLDVREFAWSIPLGLEEKVYALSLAVMEVDSQKESGYLNELSHGLRLAPEVCRQIQQRYGA